MRADGGRATTPLDVARAAANAREHEATGKVPALVFEHAERHALLPLREVHFDTDDVLTTSVGRTHQIGFDRRQYTVP